MPTTQECNAARDAALSNAIDAYDATVQACMAGSAPARTACLAGAAHSLITLLTAIAKEHANCIAGTVPGTPVPFPDE